MVLAFALVVPAMAQFEIKLSVTADADVSFADGNQVVYTADPAVVSGAALEAGDFTLIAYNKIGDTVTPPT